MPGTQTSTPREIAERIHGAWAGYYARQSRTGQPHAYVYASGWRACERRLAYEMTIPDQQPPYKPELIAKFKRGDDRERELLIDLSRVGRETQPEFRIVGQQERFTLRDRKGRTAIVGKVDARLEMDGARAPVEVKAWSPMMTDRIDRFTDLFDNPWTISGAHQLLAYLYGAGEPFGFLLLDRSGLPKLLEVELEPHLDRMEDFLAKAERTLDHVAAGTLPDYVADPAECKRCNWYGSTCNPPLSAMGAALLTDPELEALLERRHALEAAADEYAGIDKKVKAQLRGTESGICGPFAIRGKWSKQSRVVLPEDLKKRYTQTDPKGRFSLEITKL